VLGDDADDFREEIELVKGATAELDIDEYLGARQSPVFFGSALSNFGVKQLLDEFVQYAPSPLARESEQRVVEPDEARLTGFVFKFRRTWTPAIATALPSCASAPVNIARGCVSYTYAPARR
jgi:peptide chain release factor 3